MGTEENPQQKGQIACPVRGPHFYRLHRANIYEGETHGFTPVYYLATTLFYKRYEEETYSATAFINLST